MPKCPGCGSELPTAARFCPLCGQTAAAPVAAPPTPAAPAGYGLSDAAAPGAAQKKIALATAAGIAIIALGLMIFLRARAGVLNAARPDMGSSVGVLNAPPTQNSSAPLLNAPTPETPKAPILNVPKVAGKPMPDDVIAYLRWLKQFEAGRRQMRNRHEAALQTIASTLGLDYVKKMLAESNPDSDPQAQKPGKDVSREVGGILAEWNDASGKFQHMPPPNPCAALATQYQGALGATIAQMSSLTQLLTKVQATPQNDDSQSADLKNKLTELNRQNVSKEQSHTVDGSYTGANDALNAVRAQFSSMPEDIRTFDIADPFFNETRTG